VTRRTGLLDDRACCRVTSGVLDRMVRADQLVVYQETTPGIESVTKFRGKPWEKVARVSLASLYSQPDNICKFSFCLAFPSVVAFEQLARHRPSPRRRRVDQLRWSLR
jgi:hypothetical protein